jgi:hypothetical protein
MLGLRVRYIDARGRPTWCLVGLPGIWLLVETVAQGSKF